MRRQKQVTTVPAGVALYPWDTRSRDTAMGLTCASRIDIGLWRIMSWKSGTWIPSILVKNWNAMLDFVWEISPKNGWTVLLNPTVRQQICACIVKWSAHWYWKCGKANLQVNISFKSYAEKNLNSVIVKVRKIQSCKGIYSLLSPSDFTLPISPKFLVPK